MELRQLSAHDRREVLTFQRFLRLGYRPDEFGRLVRDKPGWAAYVFGYGPPPPLGFDEVAVPAWTFPG